MLLATIKELLGLTKVSGGLETDDQGKVTGAEVDFTVNELKPEPPLTEYVPDGD
jgi:hypothetical protein